jgi:hypothetical protein
MLATILFTVFCLSIPLSKNSKIKIYKNTTLPNVLYWCDFLYTNITLPVVLYQCETLSLMPREEDTLRMFENRVLRRIFGCKREEVAGEDCTMRRLKSCTLHQIQGNQVKEDKIGGACSKHGRDETCTQNFYKKS